MPPFGRLEPELKPAYEGWKAKPTPANTSVLIKKLQPAINKGIHAHVGRQVSPNIKGHAKKLTIQALNTYDPTKAGLGTHVINHLQGLRRINRKAQQVLRVPERVSLDQAYVQEQTSQMEEDLGRPPSMAELADKTGLSMRRLEHINKFSMAVPTGRLDNLPGADGGGGFSPAVADTNENTWLEAVYGDLSGANQAIMEWSLGLHGKPQLSNQQIAAKLGITPGAVSQRRVQIQQQLDKREALDLL